MCRRLPWILLLSAGALSVMPGSSRAQPNEAPGELEQVRARPTRLGPYDLTLADGSKLGIGFAGQVETIIDNASSEQPGQSRDTAETIRLRRVRLYLRGLFLDGRLKLLSQFSFLPGNPEVIDLWAEYVVSKALVVRVGQTKVPFTQHRNRGFTQLPLVDWDEAAAAFGAERQIGVMAHGQWRTLRYGGGLFAGPNARKAFARGVSLVYAEPEPSRSSLRLPTTTTDIHPALVGQIAYASEGMDASSMTDPEGGALRLWVGVSGAWDARPVATQDFLARLAPELLLKARHLTLNLVLFGGLADGAASPDNQALWGATGELTYRFHPRYEVAARYSRSDTTAGLRKDARANVEQMLMGASDNEALAISQVYGAAGTVRNVQETALGLNVYIIGRCLAFQSDVAWIYEDRVQSLSDRDSVRVRLQMQLTF